MTYLQYQLTKAINEQRLRDAAEARYRNEHRDTHQTVRPRRLERLRSLLDSRPDRTRVGAPIRLALAVAVTVLLVLAAGVAAASAKPIEGDLLAPQVAAVTQAASLSANLRILADAPKSAMHTAKAAAFEGIADVRQVSANLRIVADAPRSPMHTAKAAAIVGLG